MMEGIDETFDGVIFLGYHSSTTNPAGVRAHTMSSARLAAVRLNGAEMSEGSINAAIAGHFGVPVILVSGDDAVVEEVRAVVGDVEGAVVKWALSFHSARTLHPEAAYELIAAKVKAAIARIDTSLVMSVIERIRHKIRSRASALTRSAPLLLTKSEPLTIFVTPRSIEVLSPRGRGARPAAEGRILARAKTAPRGVIPAEGGPVGAGSGVGTDKMFGAG